MSCKNISVDLQVDPPGTNQEILFHMDKICHADDSSEWKLHFELGTVNPKANIIKLDVDIDKQTDPQTQAQAQATAQHGLDKTQQGQAKIAARTAQDPAATPHAKQRAVTHIITSRQ